MYKLVLFDVGNMLVTDSKDVSEYMSESIRNIYGRIVTVDLKNYPGWTSQEIVEDVLRKDNMDESEIQAKLHRITEDLFYTYYNVAGHDKQVLVEGSRDLLAQLWKEDVTIGMITGEAERIAKLRAEKTTIHGFFKFGVYGGDGKTFDDIVKSAVSKAESDLRISKNDVLIVANSLRLVKGAKNAGVAVIGIAENVPENELKSAGANLIVRSIKDKGKILDFIKK